MKKLLLAAFCLVLGNVASAQLILEDFDSGTFPPAGWTVVDNSGSGGIWQTSSAWNRGNRSGGSGECAAIDCAGLGSWVFVDTELITPLFDIPGNNYYWEFDTCFDAVGGDFARLEIGVGGGPWTSLKSWGTDASGHHKINLDSYAGSTNVRIRFRYTGLNAQYWHLDNVSVLPGPPPVLKEDFDSGTWPPVGWTVTDNAGSGHVWQLNSYHSSGNHTDGTGECALASDYHYGSGQPCHTELISRAFDIPKGFYELVYDHHFYGVGTNIGCVDISADGVPWRNLRTHVVYTGNNGNMQTISLREYSGKTGCRIRFRYDDMDNSAWYWHVDDVAVQPGPPQPVAIWSEDFDSGVWPPVGWTVVDNVGNGDVWQLSSNWDRVNLTGGNRECAAIDCIDYGSTYRLIDTELITPAFDIPSSELVFTFATDFHEGSSNAYGDVDISIGGGPWTNLEHFDDAVGGTVELDLSPFANTSDVRIRFHYNHAGNWGWWWQIEDVGLFQPVGSGPGTPFCFGSVASGNACPCGNDNDGSDPIGAGCAHDDFAAGARLHATGEASISNDTVVLEGLHGPIHNSSMLFQANNNLDGAGLPLGDGIRCAGGGLIRLVIKLSDTAGYVDSRPAVITARSAALGHTILPGETLYYQWWFRDRNGSLCGTESNTSNGYEITWTP